jgi:hypothetical protein
MSMEMMAASSLAPSAEEGWMRIISSEAAGQAVWRQGSEASGCLGQRLQVLWSCFSGERPGPWLSRRSLRAR